MSVRVETYSGYTAGESPRRFEASGEMVEVIEIVERWRTPLESGFRVRGGNGKSYALRCATRRDGGQGDWEIEPAGRSPGRLQRDQSQPPMGEN